MKIFSIVGLAIAAQSMLATGNTLRQQHLVIGQAVKPSQPDHYLPPPEAPVPEPVGAVGLDGNIIAPVQGTPYSFGYEHNGEQLSSSRSESSDGKKVTGHYTLQGADGVQRIVHYVADFDGFRASIQTNEPGTESHNPSGVLFQSNQLPAAELSRQYVPAEAFVQRAQPFEPQSAPHVSFVPAQQFAPAQPAHFAFTGQQQQSQQEEDDEEPAFEPQQQQQQEEVAAPIKARPLPSLAPLPLPAPSTAAPILAPIKGRPSRPQQQQQQTKSPVPQPIRLPTKSSQPAQAPAPISAPAKGRSTLISVPAPAKGRPAPIAAPAKSKPTPIAAPALVPAAVKGRPPVKAPQPPPKGAPAKRPQPAFAPRPLPAALPVPVKVVSTTARPEPVQLPQQQQQEEVEEPLPQQQQQQSFDHSVDDATEELAETEF